jgi:hypothetical protein
MTKICFAIILIAPFFGFSQTKILISRDTIVKTHTPGQSLLKNYEKTIAVILSDGTLIQVNTKLKLGKGMLPNGDFNYIATPSNTMEAKLKGNTPVKEMKIIEIKKSGNKKYGYKYIFLAEDKYIVQLEDAIATGEVIFIDRKH